MGVAGRLAAGAEAEALRVRLRELEARLQESEETLGAIHRGEVDALVVAGPAQEHAVYTLEGADGPYRILIEQIQEGALTLDQDGIILYCNRRLATMLERDARELIGRRLESLLHPAPQGGFAPVLARARLGGTRLELSLETASGTAVPVSLSLSPMPDPEGRLFFCGVMTDLTEHKSHVRELGEANARLRDQMQQRERIEEALRQSQKMEAVGQLTGGLAHDFNNLLTAIITALEILQTRLAQGRLQGIERYVSTAQDASRRAASLTHRLLAFSRRQTLAPKPTDLVELVLGMNELIQRSVGPAIAIRCPLPTSLPLRVLIDPGQMESALLNLCINARDAMPQGGDITIELAAAQIGPERAEDLMLEQGAYIELKVSDTGSGMTAEVLSRAFDPFFTTKPLGVGTGLGLSMVYGFVQQSGGQVKIASSPGAGTAVSIFLPAHMEAAAETPDADRGGEAPRAGRGEAVLVVDDEASVRVLLAEMLNDLGYRTLEASEGTAALAVLRSDLPIDLLITDVGLPGRINGRVLAEEARMLRSDLPVLFITGYAEHAILNPSLLKPGMHLQSKPFSGEVLARRIRQIIERG
ncbi:ATP-binding protein [Acidisoma sp. C75]